MRNALQEGCRTWGMHDRRDAGHEECTTVYQRRRGSRSATLYLVSSVYQRRRGSVSVTLYLVSSVYQRRKGSVSVTLYLVFSVYCLSEEKRICSCDTVPCF